MASASNKLTVKYHDIFDYPLTKSELKKWDTKFLSFDRDLTIKKKNGFYFLKNRDFLIKKRLLRENYSKSKFHIAKSASGLISKIPTVLFVGITGSLAMNNAAKDSDIDLMIIVKKNKLWTTRILVYGLLTLTGYKLRKSNNKSEEDKLCLNMWLDESSLVWRKNDRNIYTAHEIAQIIPLVNKNKTYQKFLKLNKWILNYWPNSIHIDLINIDYLKQNGLKQKNLLLPAINFILFLIEKMAFMFQYLHMKSKITRELVSPTQAIFHPRDNSKFVLKSLKLK